MDPDDDDPGLRCEMCGDEIEDVALERGYMFAEDQAICYVCAIARGGSYDAHRDTWVRAPNLTGLYTEGDREFGLRGAAP